MGILVRSRGILEVHLRRKKLILYYGKGGFDIC